MARKKSRTPVTGGKNEEAGVRFYTDRAGDRHRDHRHPGGHRHSQSLERGSARQAEADHERHARSGDGDRGVRGRQQQLPDVELPRRHVHPGPGRADEHQPVLAADSDVHRAAPDPRRMAALLLLRAERRRQPVLRDLVRRSQRFDLGSLLRHDDELQRRHHLLQRLVHSVAGRIPELTQVGIASPNGPERSGPFLFPPNAPWRRGRDPGPLKSDVLVRRRFASGILAAAALLPAVIWLWPALFSGRAPSYRDQGDFFYPLKLYTAVRLRAGEIPLWNPLSGTGEPWLANAQSGVFYPPTWLFLLRSPALAAGLFLLLHFAIAAWGARRFLKEE